jgi:GNAT superfamily N-acetyltransferase
VRRAETGDAATLRRLRAASSDGGRVAFRPRQHRDEVDVASLRGPGFHDFVAEVGGHIVGAGSLTFSQASAGEEVVDLAWLSGLVVAPDFRRQGVARALTTARLAAVADRGDPHVVAAAIQAGNDASMSNALRWADRVLGTISVTPVPSPRQKPSEPGGDLRVRSAVPADLPAIVEGIRSSSRALVLAPVPTVDELGSWLGVLVDGDPLRHYFVATDGSGRVLAGLAIEEEAKVFSLEVTRMPPAIAFANLFLRVVPRDRHLRNLNVRFPWFHPSHEKSAQMLWHQVRWRMRAQGTTVVRSVDATGPVARALAVPRWLPATALSVVVRESPGQPVLPRLPVGAVV